MKTPNEIKDEVAKSHGLKDWEEVIGRSFSTLRVHLENEAMEAYAQQFREGEKKPIWTDYLLNGFKWYRKWRKGTWYKHQFTNVPFSYQLHLQELGGLCMVK